MKIDTVDTYKYLGVKPATFKGKSSRLKLVSGDIFSIVFSDSKLFVTDNWSHGPFIQVTNDKADALIKVSKLAKVGTKLLNKEGSFRTLTAYRGFLNENSEKIKRLFSKYLKQVPGVTEITFDLSNTHLYAFVNIVVSKVRVRISYNYVIANSPYVSLTVDAEKPDVKSMSKGLVGEVYKTARQGFDSIIRVLSKQGLEFDDFVENRMRLHTAHFSGTRFSIYRKM